MIYMLVDRGGPVAIHSHDRTTFPRLSSIPGKDPHEAKLRRRSQPEVPASSLPTYILLLMENRRGHKLYDV